MNILNSIVNAPTFIVGPFILAAIFVMAGIRYKETSVLLKKYPKEDMLLVTFGVNFFGQEGTIKKPLRSVGGLVLLKDGLYYHARFGTAELYIPGKSLRSIGTTDYFCDKPLHQKVVSLSFLTEAGQVDRAAFRIPHPARWVHELKNRFMV